MYDLGLLIYMAIGLLLAIGIDRVEMTKDVPYGTMPSIISLAQIRKVVFGFFIMFGVPAILTAFVRVAVDHIPTPKRIGRRKQ